MPYLNVEVSDDARPVLLLAGPSLDIVQEFISRYKDDFRILFLSSDAKESDMNSETVTVLSKESFYFIDTLVEAVDYALFFVDSNTRTLYTGVSHLIEKGNTKMVFVISNTHWDQTPALLPHALPETSRILLLGHILQYVEKPQNSIDEFLFSALVFSRVSLHPEMGPFYSIGLDDALKGIEESLLGYHKKRQAFFLSYPQPTTFTSAAHLLKRVEPELSIDIDDAMIGTEHANTLSQITELIQTHFRVSIDFFDQKSFSTFEKEVKKIFDENRSKAKDALFSVHQKPPKKKIKLHLPFSRFITQSILLAIVGFVALQGILLITAFFFAQSGVSEAKKGNLPHAVQLFGQTETVLQFSHPLLSLALIPVSKFASTIPIELSLLPDGITTYAYLHSLHVTAKGTSANSVLFSEAIAQLQSLLLGLESHQQQLQHSPFSALSHSSLFSYAAFLGITPDLLGYKKDMTYLVLFQNNAELRPTGGFIGSVGTITFHQGTMTSFAIQDVYTVDGQLRVHIDPNYVIARNLEPNLYLRDSNFDPNFETSASQAAQLYFDSVHTKVDGVIAVDFDVLKQIIHAIGPIPLDTYHITVSDSNIFSFLENTIQDNFFPGSTKKTNVLNELQTQIQLRLEEHPELMGKVTALFPSLLSQKHILFSFQDPSLETLFSAEGVSDNNTDLRTPAPNIPDIVSINEANIGVNKVNLSISRSVTYDVTIPTSGHLESGVDETITNTDRSLDYKVYIRILSPKGSSLESISINGAPQHIIPAITEPRVYQSKGFKAPAGLEVDQSDNTYHMIGFITTVPHTTKQEILVKYTNGLTLPSTTLLSYSLLYFKQPGTETYPLSALLSYPSSFTPQNVSNAKVGESSMTFKRNVDSDQTMNASLVSKNE